jgi:ABC-type amino acid transport system permease subunit
MVNTSSGQTLRRVILPQAARTALPPLGNSFISLVKDTSLAATILAAASHWPRSIAEIAPRSDSDA